MTEYHQTCMQGLKVSISLNLFISILNTPTLITGSFLLLFCILHFCWYDDPSVHFCLILINSLLVGNADQRWLLGGTIRIPDLDVGYLVWTLIHSRL